MRNPPDEDGDLNFVITNLEDLQDFPLHVDVIKLVFNVCCKVVISRQQSTIPMESSVDHIKLLILNFGKLF